jgi:nucleotide-binding universal stress UspA family protein
MHSELESRNLRGTNDRRGIKTVERSGISDRVKGEVKLAAAGQPNRVMKILLAIDDSTFSEAAAQAVARRIRPEDAEVHVLTVVDLINYFTDEKAAKAYIPNIDEIRLSRIHDASELVERAASLLRTAGFRVTVGVSEGDPRVRIVEEAEHWKADLIVVGSHGRKGFDRALIGSVSEAVARHAPCSVAIVRIRPVR